jgi:hypothetical protein
MSLYDNKDEIKNAMNDLINFFQSYDYSLPARIALKETGQVNVNNLAEIIKGTGNTNYYIIQVSLAIHEANYYCGTPISIILECLSDPSKSKDEINKILQKKLTKIKRNLYPLVELFENRTKILGFSRLSKYYENWKQDQRREKVKRIYDIIDKIITGKENNDNEIDVVDMTEQDKIDIENDIRKQIEPFKLKEKEQENKGGRRTRRKTKRIKTKRIKTKRLKRKGTRNHIKRRHG